MVNLLNCAIDAFSNEAQNMGHFGY